MQVEKRSYDFKAENEADKQRWVRALHLAQADARAALELELSSLTGAAQRETRLKESLALVGSEDYHRMSPTTSLVSLQGLVCKGIQKAMKHELPERIATRVIHGFLQKKREGQITMYQKRWLFLVSSRPLVLYER